MNSELLSGIYKTAWTLIWIVAISGAVFLFVRSLLRARKGTDGEVEFIGSFKGEHESFSLLPERNEWKTIILLIVIYILVRISSIAIALFIKKDILGLDLSPLQNEFARWDANHYIGLARWGYTNEGDRAFHIVFYPLFPLLIKGLSIFGIDEAIAAYIQPNSFFCLSIIVMYKLLRLDFSKNVTVNAILLLIFQPFAFFFAFPFTESTFLFLSLLFFFLIKKEKWLWAGVCGVFLALTKNFGLILIVPYGVWLITVCCKRHYSFGGFVKRVLPVSGILIGFGVYLLINYIVDGNPFQFMIFQKEHWYNEISCIIRNTSLHLTHFMNENSNLASKWFLWFGNISALLFSMLSLFLGHRKVPFVYNIYLLAYIFLMMTVSWLLSGSRYMLGCFAMYIPYACVIGNNKLVRYVTLFIEYGLGVLVLTHYILGASIM